MIKEVEIKYEDANGALQVGKIVLKTLKGGEATDIEVRSKKRVGNMFATDDKQYRFLRLSKAIVDCPFKPNGKSWKEATEQERFAFMADMWDEDLIAYLLVHQTRMGHMTIDTENLLNSPSGTGV